MSGAHAADATGAAPLRAVHDLGRHVEVLAGAVPVARYVYAPDVPAVESRKPYLHPLSTLDGALVSAFRPWDHPWHKGIQMTASVLSGQNFWGGKTYRDGEYLWLDNVGRMQHDRFERLTATESEVVLDERLDWITAREERWVREERRLRFWGADPVTGVWVLDWESVLRNVRGEPLDMGSPTTLGRPDAGYTGLFWRGPRSWTGGAITASDGRDGEGMMGEAGAWLAVSGRHDDVDGGGTVLFLAGSSSSEVPLRWFVRSQPFAAINPAPSFRDEVRIEPDDALVLRHRVVVADRVWDRAELEDAAGRFALT